MYHIEWRLEIGAKARQWDLELLQRRGKDRKKEKDTDQRLERWGGKQRQKGCRRKNNKRQRKLKIFFLPNNADGDI